MPDAGSCCSLSLSLSLSSPIFTENLRCLFSFSYPSPSVSRNAWFLCIFARRCFSNSLKLDCSSIASHAVFSFFFGLGLGFSFSGGSPGKYLDAQKQKFCVTSTDDRNSKSCSAKLTYLFAAIQYVFIRPPGPSISMRST